MTIDKETALKVFRLFTCDSRQLFLAPFQQDDLQAATDGRVMAILPIAIADLNLAKQLKPNVKHVIPKDWESEVTIPVELLDEQVVAEMLMSEDFNEEDCENCGGDGSIVCYCCSHESACEDCDGKGVIMTPLGTSSLKPVLPHYFNLNGSVFDYKTLRTIVSSLLLIGAKEVTHFVRGQRETHMLKANDWIFLITPSVNLDDEKETTIKLP